MPLFLYNWLLVLHQGKKNLVVVFPHLNQAISLNKSWYFFLSQRFVCFLLCTRTLWLYFTPIVVTFHKSNYCTSPKSLRKVSCRDLQWAPALLGVSDIKASVCNGLLYFLWGKWITSLFQKPVPKVILSLKFCVSVCSKERFACMNVKKRKKIGFKDISPKYLPGLILLSF